jgi:hypothetical protein
VVLQSSLTGGWCTATSTLAASSSSGRGLIGSGASGSSSSPILVLPAAGTSAAGSAWWGAPPRPARQRASPPAGRAAAPAAAGYLRCAASSASQAARLTFTGTGLSLQGAPLLDPGSGLPLLFSSVAGAGAAVLGLPLDSLQAQASAGAATVQLSSAAGAGSILASRSVRCALRLLPSGQLALHNLTAGLQRPELLWSSATPAAGVPPFRLLLSAVGGLAVVDSQGGGGSGAWASQTGCALGSGPFSLRVGRKVAAAPAAVAAALLLRLLCLF